MRYGGPMPAYEPLPYVRALEAQGPAIGAMPEGALRTRMGQFAAASAVNAAEGPAVVEKYRRAFQTGSAGVRDRLLTEVYSSIGSVRISNLGLQNARGVGAGVVQFVGSTFPAADVARLLGTTIQDWPTFVPRGLSGLAAAFSRIVPILSAALDLIDWYAHRDDAAIQRRAVESSRYWLKRHFLALNRHVLVHRFHLNSFQARARAEWAAPLFEEINRPAFAEVANLAASYCSSGCRPTGEVGIGNRAATEYVGEMWSPGTRESFLHVLTVLQGLPDNEQTRQLALEMWSRSVRQADPVRLGEMADSFTKIWSGIINIGSEATPAAIAEANANVRGLVAGAVGYSGEENIPMATEDQIAKSAVSNFLGYAGEDRMREVFSPGNTTGHSWRATGWGAGDSDPPHPFAAMVFGMGVGVREAKRSVRGPEVAQLVAGVPRATDALLIVGSPVPVPSGGFFVSAYRWDARQFWRNIGPVRPPVGHGAHVIPWRNIADPLGHPIVGPRPTGVGYGESNPLIAVPGSSTRGGGISITPASRGLGYALDTSSAGRRGRGLVGDSWAPQGLGPVGATVAPVGGAGGNGGGINGGANGEPEMCYGDKTCEMEAEALHTQKEPKPGLGLLAAAAAALLFG